LRSNPALYISRTRLSLRQLPLFATDSLIRRLANWAIKQFEKEVKTGKREGLEEDERADADTFKSEKGKSRVKQAKVLRQADRVDPLTGLGRSKGYGFVELATHADALRMARWVNANLEAPRLLRQWWRQDLEGRIRLVEKETDGDEKERETRLKRLKDKLEELSAEEERAKGKMEKKEKSEKKNGKKGDEENNNRATRTIMVEFSIENAVTVKRREEKADRSRERSKRSRVLFPTVFFFLEISY
jgi:nucleolar protein 4